MEKHLNDLFENIESEITSMRTQINGDDNLASRLYAQKRCAEKISRICKEILDSLAARSVAYLKPLDEIKIDADKVPASDDVTSILNQINDEPLDMGELEK